VDAPAKEYDDMMLARGFRRVAMVAAASLALAAVSTPSVFAQGGGRGPGGGGPFGGMFGGGGAQMYEPSVNSKDLDSFAKLFGLDATQKETVKTLFDGYQQGFTAKAKKVREELDAIREEAREARDPELFREMGEKTMAFQKERQKMEASFLDDFKVVLTEDQAQKWPKFERMRRRDTTIGRGLMSGERVNLYELVDEMKLDAEPRAALDPTLDQYDVDLDRELIERNKMYEQIQEKMRDFFQDPQGADEWIKKGREAAVKVRDVNRRYADQLEQQLPADKRAGFRENFRKQSFPQVYRETYSTRVVDAAGKLSDLDASQKDAVNTLRETYYRDLATIQRDMEKAQEEQEMNFSISGMMGRFGGGGGGGGQGGGGGGGGGGRNNEAGGGGQRRGGGGGMFGDSEEMSNLRTKRRELETGTVDKINGLLTDAQKEKLPTRGNDDNNAGPGGRGNRGGTGDNADQPRRRGGEEGGGGGRRPNRNE
jgi:hypothetical protein